MTVAATAAAADTGAATQSLLGQAERGTHFLDDGLRQSLAHCAETRPATDSCGSWEEVTRLR